MHLQKLPNHAQTKQGCADRLTENRAILSCSGLAKTNSLDLFGQEHATPACVAHWKEVFKENATEGGLSTR